MVDDRASQALISDSRAITGVVADMGALAVGQGAITEEQFVRLRSDLEAAAGRGDFHRSVTMFGVLAHKPASG